MGVTMTFYNYELCYILAKGNPLDIIEFFNKTKNISTGTSFVLNESAINDDRYSVVHRAEYLGLCSLRNYTDYVTNKTVKLSLDLIPPWIPIDDIANTNPMIIKKERSIILLKEEIK